MGKPREANESPFDQGADERKSYKITVPTSWGTAAFTGNSGKLYSLNKSTGAYTDVTSTLMTGSQSSSAQVVTTPLIHSLVAGTRYRYEGLFVASEGNTLEFFMWIDCTR